MTSEILATTPPPPLRRFRLLARLFHFYRRRQTRMILHRLSDYQLKDIGLHRDDIRRHW